MKKIYIAKFTTGDRWELSEGVICVTAKDKRHAISEIKKRIGSNTITTLQILSPHINGVLFEHSPVIE